MKNFLILSLTAGSLMANCLNDLNNTFIKSNILQDKNNIVKCKKIDNNLELFNVKNTKINKKISFWLIKNNNKKYIFIGQAITSKGKVLNNNIVNINIIKKGTAFTFGKGKKDLYIVTDPQCPFCIALFKKNLNKLMNNYKVHIIFMPLTSIHPLAEKMVKYILAGKNNNERFKRFKELETQNFSNFNKFDFNKLDKNTQEKINKEYEYNLKASKELNANGTPSIYNSKFIPLN